MLGNGYSSVSIPNDNVSLDRWQVDKELIAS